MAQQRYEIAAVAIGRGPDGPRAQMFSTEGDLIQLDRFEDGKFRPLEVFGEGAGEVVEQHEGYTLDQLIELARELAADVGPNPIDEMWGRHAQPTEQLPREEPDPDREPAVHMFAVVAVTLGWDPTEQRGAMVMHSADGSRSHHRYDPSAEHFLSEAIELPGGEMAGIDGTVLDLETVVDLQKSLLVGPDESLADQASRN